MPGFLSNIRQSIMGSGSGSGNDQGHHQHHGQGGHQGGSHPYPVDPVRRHNMEGIGQPDGRRRQNRPGSVSGPSSQQNLGGGVYSGVASLPPSGSAPSGAYSIPMSGSSPRTPMSTRRSDGSSGAGLSVQEGSYRGGRVEDGSDGAGGGGHSQYGPGAAGADHRRGVPGGPGGVPPVPGTVRTASGGPVRSPHAGHSGPPGPRQHPMPSAGHHASSSAHHLLQPLPAPVTGNGGAPVPAASSSNIHCLNTASDINAKLDTQVEVRVYPCNNNANAAGQNPKKKFTQFTVKPEGVIIQGTNRHRSANNDLGAEYALHVGRKLQRYELSDTRACQLLVTTHNKSFWVVPAPEAFSRHSGTCRLLGDRKHPLAPHTLQVGDFLRVGSVGVVVIETHNGVENRVLSEEKIQKIMKDTTSSSGGFLDLGETDGENSDDSSREGRPISGGHDSGLGDAPVCYMCFDEENVVANPLITPCKCLGDTRYVHVNCLRKWHTAEADNQICFLSSVDATCSVCKSTFKSDFKLKDGRTMKLFKSSLEPPYVSLLVATKHEMAQRLFNTRFQLSFSTILKPDGRNGTRPLLLGRSSGSDMVLDYRTVSARHASIRFKNGEFVFTDAGSSNGSYLYLRRPVELTASQPVQFRLGRSMISMKVVNKWNRRLLRAVRRSGGGSSSGVGGDGGAGDGHSVGSNEDDVRITDDGGNGVTRSVPRRTRESIIQSLPSPGMLPQNSNQHLDLLYALAYPKREKDHPSGTGVMRKKGTGISGSVSPRGGGSPTLPDDLGHSSSTGAQQPTLLPMNEPSPVVRSAESLEEESKAEESMSEDSASAQQHDETLAPMSSGFDGNIIEEDHARNLDSIVMDSVVDEDNVMEMGSHGDGQSLVMAPTNMTEFSGGR